MLSKITDKCRAHKRFSELHICKRIMFIFFYLINKQIWVENETYRCICELYFTRNNQKVDIIYCNQKTYTDKTLRFHSFKCVQSWHTFHFPKIFKNSSKNNNTHFGVRRKLVKRSHVTVKICSQVNPVFDLFRLAFAGVLTWVFIKV